MCATAAGFIPGVRERVVFTTMMAAAVGTTRLGELATHMPIVPPSVRPIISRSTGPGTLPHWAAREFRRHDWRMLLEAGHSIGTYHASWIADIDVPTSIVLTTKDTAVDPDLQYRMAESIRDASVHEVADSHLACARRSFGVPLLAAIDDVAARN
jgi:hypothetical protein